MKNKLITKPSFGTPVQKGNVTIFPPAPPETSGSRCGRKIRTAAYVRVSTDSTQQEGSLALQKEYFENYIKSNPELEFFEIYEDDGITATNVEKRKGFLKMIEDCKAGKIDLIFTKSISRFARNLGDLLHYVNILNALNPPVEVRFEADRISTFGASGEILIMVLGLVAQEESRQKSESITWAIDNLFAQGKYYAPPVLGYDKEKGRDNPLTINEKEAKIVRLCFALTVMGFSFYRVAKILRFLELKSKPGNVCWTASGVVALLSNEKYAGELIARKTVTRSYKTQKSKKNEGEKAQYHDKKHHEPIVPPLAFAVAKKIIKYRTGNVNCIPYLKTVPEGALKGFVAVNKALRRYTLDDYSMASHTVYEEQDNSEIIIFADQVCKFDLRPYDTVSNLLFDDRTKPSCTIHNGKIIFNAACCKALAADKGEILFHPAKAILAVRTPVEETSETVALHTKPIPLSRFIPVALESAGLKYGYRYRIYGTRREKNNERIMFFDLNNAKIMTEDKDGFLLPVKYAERYGDGFYENRASCGLHKIDVEGLWQASCESMPADALAKQIEELNEFCMKSLAEFGLNGENLKLKTI